MVVPGVMQVIKLVMAILSLKVVMESGFACPPDQLAGQLAHSDTGVANGEEDPDAYMTWDTCW